jgi:large subunit ribosomal protein L1
MKRAKNYKKINEAVRQTSDLKSYIEAVCKNNPYKFDQAIELKVAVKRGGKNATPYKLSITYPNNFGKDVKVLVLAESEDAKKALSAGEDYAGLEEYVSKINDENWFDFDIVIATPAVMPKIAKLGRVLGTKGLMPNPKTGTVVTDVEAAVKEFKAGKKNFKEDKSGVINTVVAKVSQGSDKAMENLKTLVGAIKELNSNISNEIVSIHIKTTMGPSVKVSLSELMGL